MPVSQGSNWIVGKAKPIEAAISARHVKSVVTDQPSILGLTPLNGIYLVSKVHVSPYKQTCVAVPAQW
jgi:hypothetical protein